MQFVQRLNLLGYCGVQYCACATANSMSINNLDAGTGEKVGSNCSEDYVEIEGIFISYNATFLFQSQC